MRNARISLTLSPLESRMRYRFFPIDTFCQHVYSSRNRVVRNDNIDTDDREKRSISPAYLSTIHRSYDSVLGRLTRSYQPFERHCDTFDRYPSEKCQWDRFQILRGLFLTVFINTLNAFPGPRKERYPGKLGAKRRSTRESLRPFVKEEMTIVLSLKETTVATGVSCRRKLMNLPLIYRRESTFHFSSSQHVPASGMIIFLHLKVEARLRRMYFQSNITIILWVIYHVKDHARCVVTFLKNIRR